MSPASDAVFLAALATSDSILLSKLRGKSKRDMRASTAAEMANAMYVLKSHDTRDQVSNTLGWFIPVYHLGTGPVKHPHDGIQDEEGEAISDIHGCQRVHTI